MAGGNPRTSPNKATMADEPVCASAKTITSTPQTVAALHGAIPAGAVVLGWSIPGIDDDEDGKLREAFVWGDASSQPNYVDKGIDLMSLKCPVSDPTKVYVRKPSGEADVTDVVVNAFVGNKASIG